MEEFKGKKIIIGVPRHFNIHQVIEYELSKLGFEVVNISYYSNKFRYSSSWQRIESFIQKNFLRKPNFKQLLEFRNNEKWIKEKLSKVGVADYILLIRPDFFPIDFLSNLRSKGEVMAGYQWDGLRRFPQVKKYIPHFDRFFVFDSDDLNEEGVSGITNFYPQSFDIDQLQDVKYKSDVYYSGTYSRRRIDKLEDVLLKCEKLELDIKCHLFSRRGRKSPGLKLRTTDISIDYQENLKWTVNTQVLLDIVASAHNGLSLRVLEAVGFDRKLITTNSKVVDYDFYHPSNILVWENQSDDVLRCFLNAPYHPLPSDIKSKYGFQNWIKYVLGAGDYQEIELP